jgi:hypothetical protein
MPTRRARRWLRLRVILLAPLFAGCLGNPFEISIHGHGMPILFIGNSHSYVQDVPGILQGLAEIAGPEPIAIAVNAPGDVALIDHVYGGVAREQIRSRKWAHVVLQQGWTPAGACRDTLRLATQSLAADAAVRGSSVALFQVWTPTDRPAHLPGTIRSYELAAEDVGGALFPAAAAFRAALLRDPTLQLYGDGMHASLDGAYLTALVMYATIFERTPVGLPTTLVTRGGRLLTIPAVRGATLQEAAADVTVRGLGGSEGEDGPVIANPGRC